MALPKGKISKARKPPRELETDSARDRGLPPVPQEDAGAPRLQELRLL